MIIFHNGNEEVRWEHCRNTMILEPSDFLKTEKQVEQLRSYKGRFISQMMIPRKFKDDFKSSSIFKKFEWMFKASCGRPQIVIY